MACCNEADLDLQTAFRLGAFFGGGMRHGEVCGAISGALMALGLRYGDEDNRKCSKSTQFLHGFQREFGSILCRELIGQDGIKKKERCPAFIAYCAEFLEEEFSI